MRSVCDRCAILTRNIINRHISVEFICLPTDAQLNCLKNNFKFYIKITLNHIKITIIRERTLVRSLMMVITPKDVGAVLT